MTINIKNFLNDKSKMSKIGEFQNLKQIDGLEMSSTSADLYDNGRDDIVLFYFKNPISSFFFLGLIGISNGLANVLGSSTWAEIYGVKHIGSIKALTTALMVFATAFGTALFGIFIDINFSIEQIAIVSGAYVLTSIILLYSVRSKLNPQYI